VEDGWKSEHYKPEDISMWKWSWLIISVLLLTEASLASDLVREQRNAYEIRKNLVVGKAIDLKAGEQEFLAIHGESGSGDIKGAVILLHGMGSNPAWAAVVQPLRIGLTGHGWETLSLQMPLAPVGAASGAYEALIPEAAPRIAAAIAFLKQRKIKKIVIIGHSLGARMGLEALAAGLPKEVIAFVAVGAPTRKDESDTGVIGALKKIKLPILDIYGSRDLPSVMIGAKARELAARQAENDGYLQTEITGADHFFLGMEDGLLARVRSWIGKQAEGVEVKPEQDPATDKPVK
jgi:pimeloyl-ACP methyl ester carboxylesterase